MSVCHGYVDASQVAEEGIGSCGAGIDVGVGKQTLVVSKNSKLS